MSRKNRSPLAKRLLGLDVWNVGIAPSLDRIMDGSGWGEVVWRGFPGAHRFLADPVGSYEANGERRLLLEELLHGSNRGRIVSVPLDGGFISGPQQLELDDEHHLSYPFTLEHGERTLLFPECGASGRLRCFERVNGQWVERSDVEIPEPVIDPTFLLHCGHWYLFHTSSLTDPNRQLHLKASPTLSGPWTRHPESPLDLGLSGARPAGPLFRWRDRLFRPAQDSRASYGGSLAIFEVEELTPERFVQREFLRLDPPAGRYSRGVHSFFVQEDGSVAIDGKTVVYSPFAPVIKIRNIVRRSMRQRGAFPA